MYMEDTLCLFITCNCNTEAVQCISRSACVFVHARDLICKLDSAEKLICKSVESVYDLTKYIAKSQKRLHCKSELTSQQFKDYFIRT